MYTSKAAEAGAIKEAESKCLILIIIMYKQFVLSRRLIVKTIEAKYWKDVTVEMMSDEEKCDDRH